MERTNREPEKNRPMTEKQVTDDEYLGGPLSMAVRECYRAGEV